MCPDINVIYRCKLITQLGLSPSMQGDIARTWLDVIAIVIRGQGFSVYADLAWVDIRYANSDISCTDSMKTAPATRHSLHRI